MDPATETSYDPAQAEQYPCDPDRVQKGVSIPPHHLGLNPLDQNKARYAFQLLKKRQEVMEMMENLGRPVSICIKKGTLYTMTDVEAAAYHDKAASQAMSNIGRQSHNLRHLVCRAELTEDEQADYDLSCRVHAARYLSARCINAKNIDRIEARGSADIPRHLGRPREAQA